MKERDGMSDFGVSLQVREEACEAVAMNANQVVIVDREDFKYALRCARRGDDMRLTGKYLDRLLAALDRDPDIETLIAAALEPIPFRCEDPGCCDKQRERARAQARSVLAVLGEEGAARNE